PELRDEQTPIFKEALKELLQTDITNDTAVVTYLNYLSNLEHLGKLEPCGMYYDPDAADQNIVHLVARTSGAHRKYYYRLLEGPLPASWAPWAEIRLDIEDKPVVPYVWKGRLLLFWLRLMKETISSNQPPSSSTIGDLGKATPSSVWSSPAGIVVK